MIKNIVFDVGNVLFAYNPHYIADIILTDSIHKSVYVNNLLTHDIWHEMDRGDKNWNDAVHHIIPYHPEPEKAKSDVYRLVHEFHFHLTKMETCTIFESLQKRYPVYILSNFQDKPFESLENLYPHINNVAGKIVSARVNLKKPEPEIYRHLLDTYKLNPAETVFIDDLKENITAAENLGITGIHFTSHQELKKQLEKLGVTF